MQGNGKIPRYKKPGFKPIRTPKSKGMIKQYLGGKVIDGVIKYPEGVKVDVRRAAKAQALMDYNNAKGTRPGHRADMEAIYGEDYTREFERLKTAKNGPSAWRDGKER